ncbi:zinc ribbon domain-containing protein [Betaproteobacteria bacterium SCN1]|jgi:putative FmdB family regulatory protein|nr:zinc ribbon domain-containing protein [Betaproteobacteria bacterium SCN1]MBN8759630.1 zinc ribbon domain-containing protein [Thiobacillus sp.]ODU89663.1 MAG: FmdB family transcriptional regulator [Thiobacillus sp. SCN 65-179]OJW37591.1 MAG: FmdB family transcriptional regulator [Thiobacillus sp. 65-69]
MAIYEYCCTRCGPFEASRPMAESALPQACPACGTPAARAWITAPAFAGLPSGLKKAHALNERARHAPRLASQSEPAKKHGPGCSCCGGGKSKATVTAASGEKSFPTKRPWMISH